MEAVEAVVQLGRIVVAEKVVPAGRAGIEAVDLGSEVDTQYIEAVEQEPGNFAAGLVQDIQFVAIVRGTRWVAERKGTAVGELD